MVENLKPVSYTLPVMVSVLSRTAFRLFIRFSILSLSLFANNKQSRKLFTTTNDVFVKALVTAFSLPSLLSLEADYTNTTAHVDTFISAPYTSLYPTPFFLGNFSSLIVSPASSVAGVTVPGDELEVGENMVVLTVTGEDGETTRQATITIQRRIPGQALQ